MRPFLCTTCNGSLQVVAKLLGTTVGTLHTDGTLTWSGNVDYAETLSYTVECEDHGHPVSDISIQPSGLAAEPRG